MTKKLWDIAVMKKLESFHNDSGERTLIFAGSMSSGKSSMIQRFLDQTETIKKTLALEYNFGRKSGRSVSKDICHVWELGGGIVFANLIKFLIGKNKCTTLVLVLDLSCPETLWNVLETLLHSIYNVLKKKESRGEFKPCGNKIEESHEDYDYITPFPIPLIIVGGKYDLFEHFEPEKRKLICRTLRQVAHSLAASLIFYSDKDSVQVKKLKEVFHQHGFGGSQWPKYYILGQFRKGYNTDHNKALLIPCGADSFQQIDVNTKKLPVNHQGLYIERFKHSFTTVFPQSLDSDNSNIPDDPAKNLNFREPLIDLLRAQKDEELERFCQERDQQNKISSSTT